MLTMPGSRWGLAITGAALLAAPAFLAAEDAVKVLIKLPDAPSAAALDKVAATDKLIAVLLGQAARKKVEPAAAGKGATLRYGAPGWRCATAHAKCDKARLDLLKLWGNDILIDSPSYRHYPDNLYASQILGMPHSETLALAGDKALGVVAIQALLAGRHDQAYDGSRYNRGAPTATPVASWASASAPKRNAPKRASGADDSYKSAILAAARKYDVDPGVIRAIIIAKSGAGALRPSYGARNLMEISDGVAELFGRNKKDLANGEINIDLGTRLFARLLRQFNGNLHRALAAYQAGPAAVIRSGGIPNRKDVKNFLKEFQLAYRKGRFPKPKVQAVQAPKHTATKQVRQELQVISLDITESLWGNKRLAPFVPIIDALAEKAGVPAPLIKAMVMEESGGDPNAVSPKGATGIAQFMPKTAAHWGVTDRTDPLQSLAGMTKYLDYLLAKYDNNMVLAVAAYNAGEGRVDRSRGKIPNIPETKKYVRRVMNRNEALTGVKVNVDSYMPASKPSKKSHHSKKLKKPASVRLK